MSTKIINPNNGKIIKEYVYFWQFKNAVTGEVESFNYVCVSDKAPGTIWKNKPEFSVNARPSLAQEFIDSGIKWYNIEAGTYTEVLEPTGEYPEGYNLYFTYKIEINLTPGKYANPDGGLKQYPYNWQVMRQRCGSKLEFISRGVAETYEDAMKEGYNYYINYIEK